MLVNGSSRGAPPKAAMGRLHRFVEAACQATGADGGGIVVFATSGHPLDHVTQGLSDAFVRRLAALPSFQELSQAALRQLPEARDADPASGAVDLYHWLGIALPWLGSQRGVLYIVRALEQPFTAQETAVIVALGKLLEQESLNEEPFLIAKLRLLNHLAQAAADQRDLHRLLTLAIKELDRHVPRQAVAIWLASDLGEQDLFDESTSTLVLEGLHERGRSFGLETGMAAPSEHVIFADCLHHGEALYVDRRLLAESPCPLTPGLLEGGASACFVVPLRAGKRILGVLQTICTRPDGFTNEEIQLYYLVADMLGPAIAQVVLFQRLRGAYDELRSTQSQLIQNEKMRALGEMASGMAHDFNNALCGVLGFLDLALLDRAITESCRGYLDASKTCALDAAHTVRRVQEFARRNRSEGAMQPLELDELVRQTAELTRPKWESLQHVMENPINVLVATEARCCVQACAAELREALTNLIFNAVDAMPEGGTLTVRSCIQQGRATIQVQDTGGGISEEVKRRLFEPFFTTKGERGTGLGLSVAFGIIERHHGDIEVESRLGHGAKFIIRLPIWHEGAARAAPAPPEPAVAAQPGSRVLVVDDEESVRRFLSAGLQQLGYEAHLAPTAEEALVVLAREKFDILLTDLGLPGMSGDELARAVHERDPSTPIVLLTGWGDQIKAENRDFAGITHVLSKPVSLGALAQTLAAVCNE